MSIGVAAGYLSAVQWTKIRRPWSIAPGDRRKIVCRLLLIALALSLALLVLDRGVPWYYDPRRGNAPDHVIVYSTRWCPVCERLRRCLRRNDVPFEERDVEASTRAAAEWYAVDGAGVPLTVVGQQVAHGMRQEQLEPALAAGGYKVDCWEDGLLRDLRESTQLRSQRR